MQHNFQIANLFIINSPWPESVAHAIVERHARAHFARIETQYVAGGASSRRVGS